MSGSLPPSRFGWVSFKLILVLWFPQRNLEQAVLYILKKDRGTRIGIVWRMYKSLGRAFIFRIAALPNHENNGLFHSLKSEISLFRRGRWFFVYGSGSLEGSYIPRYISESCFQWNGKFSLHWSTKHCGREMLSAKDLEKLILRLEIIWKCLKSDSKTFRVVIG